MWTLRGLRSLSVRPAGPEPSAASSPHPRSRRRRAPWPRTPLAPPACPPARPRSKAAPMPGGLPVTELVLGGGVVCWLGVAAPVAVIAAIALGALLSPEQATDGGGQAPEFTLPDTHGDEASLEDALADGPALLYFPMGAGCDGCFCRSPRSPTSSTTAASSSSRSCPARPDGPPARRSVSASTSPSPSTETSRSPTPTACSASSATATSPATASRSSRRTARSPGCATTQQHRR